MDTFKRQASKLREQVAKQQQAILRQLGHLANETLMVDEDDLKCRKQLKDLYHSTREAKHFQKHIVRGVEGFISTSSKQKEIVKKLADACSEYGNENETTASPLARAALKFGASHTSMEDEREILFGVLSAQVSEPLRVLITGAPLEDARLLTHRYEKLWQDVESQSAEVLRRQTKYRDPSVSAEGAIKVQSAESKLTELKSTMGALGREAIAAMISVEDQQQRVTHERLVTMVNAERLYHQNVLAILERLHEEMTMEEQLNESKQENMQKDVNVSLTHEDSKANESDDHGRVSSVDKASTYFTATVIHPFDAQADGELSLSSDDYVLVHQVGPNGWSEGECNGKVGWFPSAYVERRDIAPTTKLIR